MGVTLTVDVVIWRWVFAGPPAKRRGNVAAAILFLIIALVVVINLLIP